MYRSSNYWLASSATQRDRRQRQRVARLLLHQADRAPTPIDITHPRRHDVTGPQPRRQCEQRDHGVPRADHPRRTGPNNPFLLAIAEDGDYRVKTFDARQIGYRLVLHVLRSPTPAQCRRRAIARQLRDQGIQDQAGSGIGNPPRFRGNHTAQGHRVRGLSKPTADRNRHVPMDVLPWRWWPLGRADTAARPPSG